MTAQATPPVAERQTMPPVRAGLLAIAGVIFLLGLSLYVFPRQTDTLFAWTIKVPLTAAFLGASYWASTTLAVACAAERAWVCARAFAPPYLIAGVVLLWVTIVHIDLFHMDDLTGWLWLDPLRRLPAHDASRSCCARCACRAPTRLARRRCRPPPCSCWGSRAGSWWRSAWR